MSENWTKGPWEPVLFPHDNYGVEYEVISPASDGYAVCSGIEVTANANLIAAAPELYEALKRVVDIADRRTDEFDAARAALKKARGER